MDGRPIELGHARQQCVLAALLMDANRVVSADQLVDRVWGDAGPGRARDTLYSYLSRLRQAFSQATDVRLVRQPGGYALQVESPTDVDRFRSLAVRARAATNEHAVALFGQAVELWQGVPFGALDNPWINQVRGQLDDELFALELDRNDVLLRLGRPITAPVGQARHPLDERLAGQLMLAAYRGGRQADALDHYRRVRTGLADELGVDPSPVLQRLYQQILAADPALDIEVRRPATDQPVPRQLPATVSRVVGRAEEWHALDSQLASVGTGTSTVITAISGTPGIGKTTLALGWAHAAASSFPDGQLYVNLRGFDPSGQVMAPAAVIVGFLTALGVAPRAVPAALDAQLALYRSLAADRRLLILLDNARDTAQVRPLLPGSPTCLVLVTSRHQLASLVAREHAQHLPLDLLSTSEARDLLAGFLDPGLIRSQERTVDELIARCAHLPLALSIAAARVLTTPGAALDTMVAALGRAPMPLGELSTGDGHDTDIRSVFSWSYQALPLDAARLFRILGLHPGPDVSSAASASAAGVSESDVRPMLGELTRANLLTQHAADRYRQHDLLHLYANELARRHDSADARQAALHRIMDHYLHSAYAADVALHADREPYTLGAVADGVTPETFDEPETAAHWMRVEHPVLIAAVRLAEEAGLDVHAWQLPWTIAAFLYRHGLWSDEIVVQRIALAAAERLGDGLGLARSHRNLGQAYALLGRHTEAQDHVERAYGHYLVRGDEGGLAAVGTSLAWVFERQGRYAEAQAAAERALHWHRILGDLTGQASALNMIGWYHAQLGDYRQALADCQEAVALYRKLGQRDGEANTLDSMGYIEHQLGQHQEAIAHYTTTLALRRELVGHRFGSARTLLKLGDTLLASGDEDAARTAYRDALSIFEEFGGAEVDTARARLAALP
ncbi:MAG TPA: tetratricopeptide repeat protein [Pseudonocardiaceae bacterium]|nr:tetratricopeptide repeat protein [Pseudonocardiaceae bacterium]